MTARWAAVLMAAVFLQSCGGCGKAADGADSGLVCPANSHPERDSECVGNVGCNRINQAACGCRCTMCNGIRCVEFVCQPACDAGVTSDAGPDAQFDAGVDGGRDTGVLDSGQDTGTDAGADAGVDASTDAATDGSIECKEPGDLEGVYLDRDWNAPVVFIENDFRARISEKYLAWLVPLNSGNGKALRFLDLDTKKVGQIPNCQGEHYFNELSVKGSVAMWTNAYTPPNGQMRRAAMMSDLSKKDPPRPVSMDEDGSVFYALFDGDNLVYNFSSRSPNIKSGNYHTDMSTGITKRLDVVDERILYPDMLLLDADIFGKTVINVGGTECSTFDIDKLEVRWHPHNTGDRDFVTGHFAYKVSYESWLDSEKHGHPSTDIFVFDVSDDSNVRLTEDERSQILARIYDNFVLWKELANDKAEPENGYGYYVVYDLDTGARRRIPGVENDGWPYGLTKTHAAIRGGSSSISGPLYLVDLEKAGVVKDGHVVPEAGDGGAGGQ